MTYLEEVRGRMNPRGLTVTDVMVGGGGIQRSWLKVFRVQLGAALWSSLRCWLTLGAAGIGFGAVVWASLRMLGS